MLLTDKQTDQQTNATETITSFAKEITICETGQLNTLLISLLQAFMPPRAQN